MATIEATTPQLRFLKSYFEAYETLNIDNVEPFYSKNLKAMTSPKTDEQPDLSKDEYIQKKASWLPRVAKTEPTIHEVAEAPGQITMHLTVDCTAHDGGKHLFETVCVLKIVEEEGQLKIIELTEFSSPVNRNKFESGLLQVQPLKG